MGREQEDASNKNQNGKGRKEAFRLQCLVETEQLAKHRRRSRQGGAGRGGTQVRGGGEGHRGGGYR